MNGFKKVAEKLVKSSNPSIRWKVLVNVFDENPKSKSITKEDGRHLVESSSENKLCMKFLDVKAILMSD